MDRRLPYAMLAVAISLASCSAAGSVPSPAGGSISTTAEGGAPEVDREPSTSGTLEWCEAYADAMAVAGLGVPPEGALDEWVADVSATLDAVSAGSPTAVAQAVERMITAMQPAVVTGDFSRIREVMDSSAYAEDADKVAAFVIEECAFAVMPVTAIEYAYDADFSEVEPGHTAIELVNAGAEIHELFLVRISDESTQSIEDILTLPPGEAFAHLTRVGVTLDPPSASSVLFVDLQPGRYAVLCLIPSGATPDKLADLRAGRLEGPPHFTQGMVREFLVDG